MRTSNANVASAMVVLVTWGVSIMGFVSSGSCTAGSLAQTDANPQAASSGWVPTGGLNIARSRHTATRLQNGRVLVAGGYSNTAEVYNPALGVWSFTATKTGRLESRYANR